VLGPIRTRRSEAYAVPATFAGSPKREPVGHTTPSPGGTMYIGIGTLILIIILILLLT
jgi:hypothetical protein